MLLVGGYGTRMQPYSNVIPKCLLPLAGKPTIRHTIDNLLDYFIEDAITLCVNKWALKHYEWEFRDLNVMWSVSDSPLGTSGEIYNARNQIKSDFITIYGDSIIHINYDKLINQFSKDNVECCLVASSNVSMDYGIMEVEGNKLISFVEKPIIKSSIWAGIGVWKEGTKGLFLTGEDIAKNVIPRLLKTNSISIYNTNESYWDVGNLVMYQKANGYFGGKNDDKV